MTDSEAWRREITPAVARKILLNSHHGPTGRGEDGACRVDCLKCAAENVLRTSPTAVYEIDGNAEAGALFHRPSPAISISELGRLRSAMTPGEWSAGDDPADGEVWDAEQRKLVVHRIGRAPIAGNTSGIVAEHNAIPVLLDVVRAVKTCWEQRDNLGAVSTLEDALAKVTW